MTADGPTIDRRGLVTTTAATLLGTAVGSGTAAASEDVGPTVYVGTNWRDDGLYAIDAETGEERWRYGQGLYRPYSAPTVVDGTIYIGYDGTDSLHAIDADTGDRVWRFEGASHFLRTPTVVDASSGDSVDSRVMLGTLDHHDAWANDQPSPDTDPGLEDYADKQTGQIKTSGVIAAAGDWQAGEIGASLLLEIFDAWQCGKTVL